MLTCADTHIYKKCPDISNPTEINSTWNPAGDDVAGWAWSFQSYDWQGRPLVSTDTLGKTKQASYTGCGCAGGLSVTYTDEMGRKRQVISDSLGRQWKTQVLKANGTVYSTTANTYNVRNQVTNVEEKDEISSVTQQTVMTYDGHGRLKTRKRPQEDAATTFDYYADDRLQHSKDARNAEGTLTYNNRGLMISATYVTPGNVAPTSTVTFQYDSTGQRTLMDDGPGQVSYQYDGLSRLISETRVFDAIADKSFGLSYDYNLGWQLKSLTYSATNAPSDTINYARDKAGQITAITGTPYGGVTSYANGIQYRAWGAPKAVSYGSGFTASAKFNVRMQVSEFDIPGVIGGTYTYNDDRQLNTFVASTPQHQQYDTRMNRTFGYDEFGRMSSSVAGGSGFYATFNPQQDAFGNVTNSSYHYWQNNSTATTFAAAYQNNRVTSVSDNGLAQTWNYDTMGNRTGIIKTSDGTTLESINIDAIGRGVAGGATLDGQGQAAIFQGNYYIRSTVFGGEIITTVDSSGAKTSGRVLDDSSMLAEQIKFSDGTTTVRWHHRDPLNLVARDAEPGQIKRRVHAVTPNGAQIETSEGVNLNQYYACLLAGNNNPTCTGFTPQVASTYGGAANQANGLLAAGLKVDGVLTLKSLSDIARQIQRTGYGSIIFSTSLFGTSTGASLGVTAGSWRKREAWSETYGFNEKGQSVTTATDESTYEWVPGGEGLGADFGLTGGQQGAVQLPPALPPLPIPPLRPPSSPVHCRPDVIKAMATAWSQSGNGSTGVEAGFRLDGSPDNYRLVPNRYTNQQSSQTMTVVTSGVSKTFAVFHVHPNRSSRNPSTPENNYLGNGEGDTGIADRLKIDFYVMHRTGLSMYDHNRKQIIPLRNNLDWLKPCN